MITPLKKVRNSGHDETSSSRESDSAGFLVTRGYPNKIKLNSKGENKMGEFGPKKHSKARGELSEAIIIARLLEAGYGVLTPFGDSARYDLVIEDADSKFWRIQYKTAWAELDGAIIKFNAVSNHYHYGSREQKSVNRKRDYQGQIDYFAAYSPDTGKTYLLPVAHVGTIQVSLRLTPTKNNQDKNIKWAKDYEI